MIKLVMVDFPTPDVSCKSCSLASKTVCQFIDTLAGFSADCKYRINAAVDFFHLFQISFGQKIPLIDADHRLYALLFGRDQKTIDHMKIRLGPVCRKDDDKTVHIGNRRPDKVIFRGSMDSITASLSSRIRISTLSPTDSVIPLFENASSLGLINSFGGLHIVKTADTFNDQSPHYL